MEYAIVQEQQWPEQFAAAIEAALGPGHGKAMLYVEFVPHEDDVTRSLVLATLTYEASGRLLNAGDRLDPTVFERIFLEQLNGPARGIRGVIFVVDQGRFDVQFKYADWQVPDEPTSARIRRAELEVFGRAVSPSPPSVEDPYIPVGVPDEEDDADEKE